MKAGCPSHGWVEPVNQYGKPATGEEQQDIYCPLCGEYLGKLSPIEMFPTL